MCVFPLCAVLPRLIPLCRVVVCLSLFSFLLLLDALLIPVFCLDTLWGKEIGDAVGGQLERASLDGHCRSLGLPRILLNQLPCLMLGMASMRSVHV